MTTLHIHWRPKTGEAKQAQLRASEGKVLPAAAFGLTGAAPLARPVDGGWEITVPDGTSGQVGKGEQFAPLSQFTFHLGGQHDEARLAFASGSLRLRVEGAAAAAPVSAPQPTAAKPAAPTPPKAAPPAPATAAPSKPTPPSASAPPAAPRPSGTLPPSVAPAAPRSRAFGPVLGVTLVLHVLLMIWLGTADVPESLYTDASQIPERFARLIVPKKEEPKEEAAGKGEEAKPVKEQPKEEPKDEGDAGDKGGDKPKEAAAPRSKAEIREAVRSKGILAVLGAKKGGGGALSDVLGEGGLAGNLDQALDDVGGVVVAGRGMDVRSARGSGGGKAAGIGDLEAGAGRGMGLGSKAERKVAATVDTAAFESSGSLSSDAIREVVQKQIRGVRYCYEKELANKPDLAGKVVVRITIGEDGSVAKFEIESTTLNDSGVEGCILQRVRRWTFPKPESGTVSVSLPFVFTAAS